MTAIRHLPAREIQDPVLLAERDREKEVVKKRLAALTRRSAPVLAHIERAVALFNGVRGEPGSFDNLDGLLAAQAYRVAYWRVAAEEINYRRFFDINELGAIRVEDPAAFDRVHAFPFALLAEGAIDGFRVDHVDGQSYPSRSEEYLIYQTLVGTWPLDPMTPGEERHYCDRIVAYMHKAMREAKVYTSWLNPSEAHERAMTRFVQMTLAEENTAFRSDFIEFQHRIAQYGIYNSLAQVASKIGAPGVPDFYQGTELWDFSLVDPDNRRPVDYDTRRVLLAEFDAEMTTQERGAAAVRLMQRPRDGRLKLYATSMLLRFRRAHQELFQSGRYQALGADGARRDHVFAFSRTLGDQQVLVVVPRLPATLLPDASVPPLGERVWGDTAIALPAPSASSFRHVLTGQCIRALTQGDTATIRAADVFEQFPIAFLEGH